MNQKQKKLLCVLFAMIAVLSLLLFALTRSKTDTAEEATVETDPLSGMLVENITAIGWTEDGKTVSFTKQDNVWLYDGDNALPIDQQELGTVITKTAALSATRVLTGENLNEGELGLDSPTRTLTLTDANGTWELFIGSKNSVTGEYYAKDANGLYTVDSSALAELFPSLESLYEAQQITDMDAETLESLTVQWNEQIFVFEKIEGSWTLEGETALLEQDVVDKIANTFCEMVSSWTVTAPAAEESYGLERPELVMQAVTEDGRTAELRFGAVDIENENLRYLQTEPDHTLYEVNTNYLAAFEVDKDSLYADEAESTTAENAQSTENIVAEHPVGGTEDYADYSEEK